MTKFKNYQNENSQKIESYKLKIAFFGTPDYVNPIIKALDENFDLIKTVRSPAFQPGVVKLKLETLNPDLFVVASFGKIIPKEILEIPESGAINIHPSRLPKYRGPSPIQAQILDGISDCAISFILMDEEMDHGPILHQEPFRISEEDTFESLCKKMFAKSAEILPSVINDLSKGKITPRLQDHAIAEYCNLVKKQDGYFEINNPPDSGTLDKMIRAYYPWPGTWTKWNGKIVKFLPTSSLFPLSSSPFLIQIEGKKPTDLKSFLNGYPDFPMKLHGLTPVVSSQLHS